MSLPRILLTSLLAAFLAFPAAAYTIYLKDGSKIIAREKYRTTNGKAIIVLQNGTETFIDAGEIDVARTEAANRHGYGTATVLDEGGIADVPREATPPQRQTLADLIASRSAAPRDLPESRRDLEGDRGDRLPRTKAGYPDLILLPRRPYRDLDLAAEVQKFFRGQGLEEVQIYQGTRPDRLLVEITTNSEASVFRALKASAGALLQIRDLHPDRPDRVGAFEVLLLTASHQRAGQFLFTPEAAADLLEAKMEVAAFFLANVQF